MSIEIILKSFGIFLCISLVVFVIYRTMQQKKINLLSKQVEELISNNNNIRNELSDVSKLRVELDVQLEELIQDTDRKKIELEEIQLERKKVCEEFGAIMKSKNVVLN